MSRAPWKEVILSTQAASHGQGANFEQLVYVDPFKLRIQIHADTSYAFQSRAAIEVWTPAGWSEVARILAAEVTNTGVTKYEGRGQVPVPAGFERDRRRLLDMARLVLAPFAS